jgi:P protein
MVGIFSQTGFFEWSAVKAFKWAKGEVWKLVVILCIFTAVVSAFLDNVTTILLITPVTIRLANVMETSPQQILIALVMFSNIGGTATPVGDPPNIIILSDKRVQKHAPEINFGTFTLHMTPGVILASLTSYFVVRYFSLKAVKKTDPYQKDKREIAVWKKSLTQMRTDTKEEQRVRTQLEEYVASLEDELEQKMQSTGGRGRVINIAELEQKYPIRDKSLLVKCCIVLGFVIMFFFMHSAIHLELSLAWISIIGAIALLVVSGIRDIEEVLEKVEFGTLMFFAGLFVLMETLDELGLITFVGERTVDIIASVPPGQGRLAAAVVIVVWVSALVSAFIDNIPYTAAMVPVVVMLGTDPDLDIPLSPLIYALAFGTCMGGNGTLIGASANVVAAGLSESEGYPISFNYFFRTGFPTMIVSVLTITVYLLIFHVAIPWR